MDYLVWGVATDDDVTKFQTPAELHADRLLDSARPGHDALNRAIDQLPKD